MSTKSKATKFRKVVKIIVIMVVVSLVTGTLLVTDTFYFKYRRQFPYSKDPLLVWKVDEPGGSLIPNTNLVIDPKRDLVITSFNLDENAQTRNKLFSDNCKHDSLHSCLFFINAEDGTQKHALTINGQTKDVLDTADFAYYYVYTSKKNQGQDTAKILRINKDSFQVTTVWEKEGKIYPTLLKSLNQYILFTYWIEGTPYKANSTYSLVFLNTSNNAITQYPKEISDSRIEVVSDSQEMYRIIDIVDETETPYNIATNKIESERHLTQFEMYHYLHEAVLSPDGNIAYVTMPKAQVKAVDKFGNTLWQTDSLLPSDYSFNEHEKIVEIDDKPYLDDNNVYVSTQSRQFYAIDRATGQIRWVTDLPSSVGRNFVVYKNKAYFANFGVMFRPSGLGVIDLSSGKLVHLEQPESASKYWWEWEPVLSPPYIYLQNTSTGVYKFKLLD